MKTIYKRPQYIFDDKGRIIGEIHLIDFYAMKKEEVEKNGK